MFSTKDRISTLDRLLDTDREGIRNFTKLMESGLIEDKYLYEYLYHKDVFDILGDAIVEYSGGIDSYEDNVRVNRSLLDTILEDDEEIKDYIWFPVANFLFYIEGARFTGLVTRNCKTIAFRNLRKGK